MTGKFIITIDLGGTNLKLALLDLRFHILSKEVLSTQAFKKPASLIGAIADSIDNFIQTHDLSKKNILGVGLGLPGPIDVKKGLVHYFPNIPGWKDVGLKAILEKRTGLKVYLDNDANLMSLGEFRLGAARGAVNAICLTLGTGVGSGVIINRKLFRAETFAAGEAGHIPINESGPRCNCGGNACLEVYIGNHRIEAEARKVFRRNISLEELSSLAKAKNQKAIKIWLKVGRRLGVALVGMVNLLSPECVVIGGGVANAGKILFDEVRKTVYRQAMPIQAKHLSILKAELGSDAGLIGAGILVKEKGLV
ncbi:MAG: ROK family protein [Candidatus Omnitrophica bacterium]|nr:ROK family protein [Candidatus Omnitrophota bacterium]